MQNTEELPTIETTEEVMFFDTDCGGVVHNIAYLRFIETNRTKLAGVMGMALKEMADSGVFPVVVRTEIDYRKPAALGDVLKVSGRLEAIEGIRFWFGFEIRRGVENAELLVQSRQQLALVKMPSGKPQRLPVAWKQYGI